MKFYNFKYQRINLEKIKSQFLPMIDDFDDSSFEKQVKIIHEVNKINDNVESMFSLASIRNSLDTKDEFYQQEKKICDENAPILAELNHNFKYKIIKSKYYHLLLQEFGEQFFIQIKLSLKTFDPKIIPHLQQENRLITQYQKLISDPTIKFENQLYNLSQMAPFLESKKRETRKEAQLAVSDFFAKNEAKYDNIYDKLVKLRTEMAHLLGYKNFVELGYDLLGRTDYNASQIDLYRQNIQKHITPFYQMMKERKSKRIGVTNLQSYDAGFHFLSGNPVPQGDIASQVKQAQNMYHNMSSQTKVFFDYLLQKEVLDLTSKPNKTGGGYCAYLPQFQTPFIFANFNGTSHDIDVLTHEVGHAFQVYQSRHLIPEYRWPTLDAAEICSMGMEFLAWPWMQDFFGDDVIKYKFLHLSQALNFLLYGALVDHFQHEIYKNPQLNPEQRKKCWRKLEKKYLLIKEYKDDSFLEKGNFWFKQSHIFSNPFYYIDYTLAQVCALELWIISQNNYQQAWQMYVKLCQKGGSKSFLTLLQTTELKSPFDEKHLQNICNFVTNYLQKNPYDKF